MNQAIKAAVDATWAETFGVSPADFRQDAVLVIANGDEDDVVSVMVDRACVLRVPAHLGRAAHELFSLLTAEEAFSASPLEQLVQGRGDVLGLSWHHYGNQESLRPLPDPEALQVRGDDAALMGFLERTRSKIGPRAGSRRPRRRPIQVMSSTG